jgi:hypothetical protein
MPITLAADARDGVASGPGAFLRPVYGPDGQPTGGQPPLADARTRGSGRQPGSLLIAVAAGLLLLLGLGLFAVSIAAQYRYVLGERHQIAPSVIEALALDLAMTIFSLLALGLARGGKSAGAERVLITACAAASGVMNFAAADDASPKSVLAYVMPPLLLAVVADRVISVARRHVLGDDAQSPWQPLGRGAVALLGALGRAGLYGLRLIAAPPGTVRGLRRKLLNWTPLPEPSKPSVTGGAAAMPPVAGRNAISAHRVSGPREGSKTARFLALVAERHGPLASFPVERVSRTSTELAPDIGLDAGAARTALRKAVLAARDGHAAGTAPRPVALASHRDLTTEGGETP